MATHPNKVSQQSPIYPSGEVYEPRVSGRRLEVVGPPLPAGVNQAFQVLRFGFTVAPIIAGVDKFFHLLVNWDQYLAPVVNGVLGGHGHTFMLVAGVVEIIAGIGVALLPRVFGYVVSAWLLGIVVNLLLVPGYFDIALRDFGLCLAAFAMARLASARHQEA